MRKILLITLLFSSISLGLYAQQKPKNDTSSNRKRTELVDKTAEEIAKKRTDHIDKEVKLTDNQRKEVYALYLKEAKEKIEEEEKASLVGKISSTKGSKVNSNVEVHKLLTPEQQQVLADKKEKKSAVKKKVNNKKNVKM